MSLPLFNKLWKFHPGRSFPCNRLKFENQCAIRMGEALRLSNVDLSSFKGAKCWEKHEDKIKHILRAQELANWIDKNPHVFGNKTVFNRENNKNVTSKNFWHVKGIIFFQDGWGPTDHIDIWDGTNLKGGYLNYFTSDWKSIWVWQLV